MKGQIEKRQNAVKYILGGNATFTVVSNASQARFTYRVRRHAGGLPRPVLFVDVLTGPDNENDFVFIGTLLRNTLNWKRSEKSSIAALTPSVQVFSWIAKRALADDRAFGMITFYHSGRCSKCGRMLTDPVSIETGLGPVCRERMS